MVLCLALALPAPAQVPTPSSSAPAAQAPQGSAEKLPWASTGKSFSQEELDQLLAPIALYPDALLAQVLMASTYPLEVVSAERWVKANPTLKDKALEDALQQQTWDPSVKSLAVFPQVLTMMSEKIDWTQKLGDAFLAQQKEVMATAQSLRAKAQAQGALKDSKEQKVGTDTSGGTTVITIESTSPEVVYVPTYDPMVVYGAWPYPAYPPYYWYPPGYVYAPGLWFAAGVAAGWAIWGNCNWRGGDVNINVNRYNNFNRTNISNGNWNHNAQHRGAVPYRDQGVAKQYGRGQSADAASREAFRGRADAGRESIQRGEVSSRDLSGRDLGSRDAAAGRDFGGGRDSAASRDMSGTRNGSAFDTGRSAQTRDYSNRGSSSMSSARSSGNMSSGARAGGMSGGGARAGGGGGRGGGRR
jgi:hypothetical protein